MEPLEPELESLTLVFLGAFSPGIVQPSWLARHQLISESEADTASISLISNDYTQFRTDWANIDVFPDRLQLASQLAPYYISLGDLAVGVLTYLPEVRVTAVGINHVAHFKLRDQATWHKVGHSLVPKDFWSRLLRNPGTGAVSVQGERPDEFNGRITLTLAPSARVEHGLFLSSNDHVDVPQGSSDEGARLAASYVNNELANSIGRSQKYFGETISYSRKVASDE